ncbi:hypothetical protein C8R44DRAFT_740079 [Mycena epipterygia]|nr:hypothetical protein C8R44DRAFT_740079 [Mycena epipterygia]
MKTTLYDVTISGGIGRIASGEASRLYGSMTVETGGSSSPHSTDHTSNPFLPPKPGSRRSAPRLFRTTFKYSGLTRSIRARAIDTSSSQSTVCETLRDIGYGLPPVVFNASSRTSNRHFGLCLSSDLFFHPDDGMAVNALQLTSPLAEVNGKIRALESNLALASPTLLAATALHLQGMEERSPLDAGTLNQILRPTQSRGWDGR